MDDLDNFFGDDAAKAFADAIDIRMDTEEGIGMLSGNNLNTEGREAQDEFFQAMLTHDDIILSAQFGDDWEKQVKNGKFQSMNQDEVVNRIHDCCFANQFYPKDRDYIKKFVVENAQKEQYNHLDTLQVTRQMIVFFKEKEGFKKTQQEESKK